jgi:hypothetical protein
MLLLIVEEWSPHLLKRLESCLTFGGTQLALDTYPGGLGLAHCDLREVLGIGIADGLRPIAYVSGRSAFRCQRYLGKILPAVSRMAARLHKNKGTASAKAMTVHHE